MRAEEWRHERRKGMGAMVPTWMIEDIERRRREREDRERPQLRIELPVRTENEPPPRRPAPSGRIVIELGGAPRDDRAVLENAG